MVLKVVSEALPRNFQNAARKENAASKGTETNVLRRPSFVARSSFDSHVVLEKEQCTVQENRVFSPFFWIPEIPEAK